MRTPIRGACATWRIGRRASREYTSLLDLHTLKIRKQQVSEMEEGNEKIFNSRSIACASSLHMHCGSCGAMCWPVIQQRDRVCYVSKRIQAHGGAQGQKGGPHSLGVSDRSRGVQQVVQCWGLAMTCIRRLVRGNICRLYGISVKFVWEPLCV